MEVSSPFRKKIEEYARIIYGYSFFLSTMAMISFFSLFILKVDNLLFSSIIYLIIISIGAYLYNKYILKPQKEYSIPFRKLIHNSSISDKKKSLVLNSFMKRRLSNLDIIKQKYPSVNSFMKRCLLNLDIIKQKYPSVNSFMRKRLTNIDIIKQKFLHLDSFNILLSDIEPKTISLIQLTSIIIGLSVVPLIIVSVSMQGYETTDMNSIYDINESVIPISIITTGPNTGLIVKLFNASNDHNLTLIDSIELKSKRNQNEIKFGNNLILFGNPMEFGKYNVFINTTNLKTGYYELILPRYSKGFYLK